MYGLALLHARRPTLLNHLAGELHKLLESHVHSHHSHPTPSPAVIVASAELIRAACTGSGQLETNVMAALDFLLEPMRIADIVHAADWTCYKPLGGDRMQIGVL